MNARSGYIPERVPTEEESVQERTEYPAQPEFDVEPGEPNNPIEDLADPEPVSIHGAVTIINSELVDWTSGRYLITADYSTQIAGNNRNRKRAVVTVPTGATNSVFLLRESNDPVAYGYELAPGDTIELKHNDAVWARCEGSDTQHVSIVTEFVVVE